MTRPECWGNKEDHSDKCDFYDTEGYCRWYGDTWKDDDGVYRGGEEVERITYCTKRTRKGKRINDAMNPLYMDRICHWTEVMFDGEVRSRNHDLYNPSGIIVWGDGTMHDPVSKKTIYPDGTVVEDDHWGGDREMRESFEESIRHMKECQQRDKDNKAKTVVKKVEEIIRKPLKIDETPDCYLHHKHNDDACKKCFCENECRLRAGE